LKSPGLKEEHQPESARDLICLDSEAKDLEIPVGYVEAQIKRVQHSLDGYKPRKQLSDEERLWSKVEKSETCWNWLAGTNNGYGQGVFNGVIGPAHRIIWMLEVGSDPGLFYMQNDCGKRSCVNPQHWSISLRRKSMPGEKRVSEFVCTKEGCSRPARTLTRPGLCEPCTQSKKRSRRRDRERQSYLCRKCGLPAERRGRPSSLELCSGCRSLGSDTL